MTCQIHFLAVGNADCCVAVPDSHRAVVVDIGSVRILFERLNELAVEEIGALYITHEHTDHMPALCDFEEFVTSWLKDAKKIGRVLVPRSGVAQWHRRKKELKEKAATGGPESRKHERQAQRIDAAIRRLDDYRFTYGLTICSAEVGTAVYVDGDFVMDLLHPSLMFMEKGDSPKPNDASTVLRLRYGQFAALLLGDLDGKGLTECLRQHDDQLRAHVVKVPHHGAWPKQNSADLERLLQRIKPEFAVLSVGSTNAYKHVAPQLFALLLQLKAATGLGFICTQATRTCRHTAAERQAMNKSGLPAPMPCAGDVTIMAQRDGTWVKQTAMDHLAVIKTMPYVILGDPHPNSPMSRKTAHSSLKKMSRPSRRRASVSSMVARGTSRACRRQDFGR